MNSRHKILSKGLRRDRGTMNKTEAAYAEDLKACVAAGEIAAWWFEPCSLRLSRPENGQPARYTPDFLVLLNDGTTCFDDIKTTSGFDDYAGVVRIKCAAEQYPLWKFRIVRKKRMKDGGGWDVKEV